MRVSLLFGDSLVFVGWLRVGFSAPANRVVVIGWGIRSRHATWKHTVERQFSITLVRDHGG